MKMMTDFKYESVSRICEKLSNYLTDAEAKVNEINNMLRGKVNEIVDSAG